MIESMSNKKSPILDDIYTQSLNDLGSTLHQLHEQVNNKVLSRLFNELQHSRIEKMSQANAIFHLHKHQRLTITEISRHANLSLPATSHMIDRFVKYGIAIRHENPTNRREKMISLTEKGISIFQKIEIMFEETYKEMLTSIDLTDLEKLQNSLEQVRSRLTPKPIN